MLFLTHTHTYALSDFQVFRMCRFININFIIFVKISVRSEISLNVNVGCRLEIEYMVYN